MKFLKLTETFQNGDKQDIFINFNMVNMFKIGDRKTDTFIQMNNGKFFFVKESMEIIKKKLTE